MKVKFEPIRIGKFRQDPYKEKILKENYANLKAQIREFLYDPKNDKEIQMDIVIPARGSKITVTLDGINDEELKKHLIQHFPNSIYKGDYSILLENIDNSIFSL